jgi:hypothetical protein
MRKDELMKADLFSEILLPGSGVAIVVAFGMVVVAAISSAARCCNRPSTRLSSLGRRQTFSNSTTRYRHSTIRLRLPLDWQAVV